MRVRTQDNRSDAPFAACKTRCLLAGALRRALRTFTRIIRTQSIDRTAFMPRVTLPPHTQFYERRCRLCEPTGPVCRRNNLGGETGASQRIESVALRSSRQ